MEAATEIEKKVQEDGGDGMTSWIRWAGQLHVGMGPFLGRVCRSVEKGVDQGDRRRKGSGRFIL